MLYALRARVQKHEPLNVILHYHKVNSEEKKVNIKAAEAMVS